MIRLKSGYNKTPQVTVLDGVTINLAGDDLIKVTPAKGLVARKETLVKAATQAQLKELYDIGHPLLEVVVEPMVVGQYDGTKASKAKKVGASEVIVVSEGTEEIEVPDIAELQEEQ